MSATGGAAPFDPAKDEHVAVWDEAPLWSAQAGLLLLEHVPLSARRMLDLGCGAGFPLLELAERMGRGAFAVGIDPWATALRRAQAKRRTWPVPNAALVRGDGSRLPFRDGSFDLVTSNLGVNNFDDPDGVLAECRRVIAPRGRFALATNVSGYFAELYAAMAEVLADLRDQPALERLRAHVAHRGTVASIGERLERAGLSVESVHERMVTMRFRDSAALFDHHFMRLGFVAGWKEVAGSDETLEAIRKRLDGRAVLSGDLKFTVPLAVIVAAVA